MSPQLRSLIVLIVLSATCHVALGQTPQALNYQAVARDAAGAVLVNQTVNVKISVVDGSVSGTTVYQETHGSLTTNPFGLFALQVGNGTPGIGAFSSINWVSGAKYLKVEVDFGSGYTDMGTSQLVSVPYALLAKDVENDNDQQTLSITGSDLSISNGNSVTLPTGVQTLNDLTDVNTVGASNNQVLQWNGSNWVPATVSGGVGDNWGTQTVVADAPLSGNGTSASHLKITNGTTTGQVLRWNGTAWIAGTDADAQTLTLSGSNLSISGGNAVTLPSGGGGDNWGSQTVVTNATLTGTGVTGNALGLAQQSATNGQVLKWNGSTWAPAADNNTDAQTLSLAGNSLSISGGNNVTLPTGTTYTAGSGINISGNTISATDNSTTNEIQALTLSGSTLTLSNGGGNVTLPDASATNEIQTLAVAGNQLTISGSGGNTVTLPGGGLTLPYVNTVNSTSTLFDITNSGSGAAGNFVNSSTTGITNALTGYTFGTGYGVYGYNNNGSGSQVGVFGGYNGISYGAGVAGIGWGGTVVLPSGVDIGVYGSSNVNGVYGHTASNSGYGVSGVSLANGTGVRGTSTSGIGVYGSSELNNGTLTSFTSVGKPAGYFNSSGGQGVYNIATGTSLVGLYTSTMGSVNVAYGSGTYAVGTWNTATNPSGDAFGSYNDVPASPGGNTFSIYGTTNGSGATGAYAGGFFGDVDILGNLSKSGGTFKIDHPLDPANKYLYHSFVESPDMMNIYNGNVSTDANGNATVELPSYFEAENKDFRYQLTAIGTFAQAIISEKINNNTFKIKTDKPNVEVSWQITGVRNDPWAQANRVVPVVEKKGKEKGHYLFPSLYNQPETSGIRLLREPPGDSHGPMPAPLAEPQRK